MRVIGQQSSEELALRLGDFLYVNHIHNQIEQDASGNWSIWVHDEDQMEKAGQLLQRFNLNPLDPEILKLTKDAKQLREAELHKDALYQKQIKTRETLFRRVGSYSVGPLTLILIVISSVVYLITNLNIGEDIYRALMIADPQRPFGGSFAQILHGEVWRLITPIFLHFSLMHIFFNMLWLYDLGNMIEGRQSTKTLLLLVIVIAVISNVFEYVFKGAGFGGMSGVVYGLFGYIWIRGKYDPGSGLFLHQSTVVTMLIWYALCLTGLIGHVANLVHTGGLVVGISWGYLSSQLRHRS